MSGVTPQLRQQSRAVAMAGSGIRPSLSGWGTSTRTKGKDQEAESMSRRLVIAGGTGVSQ